MKEVIDNQLDKISEKDPKDATDEEIHQLYAGSELKKPIINLLVSLDKIEFYSKILGIRGFRGFLMTQLLPQKPISKVF